MLQLCCFVVMLSGTAFAFTDDFSDESYAGVWDVDRPLDKYDGTNWQGWIEEGMA